MSTIKAWAKRVVYSNTLRRPYSAWLIPRLARQIHPDHKLSFYVLSTGRVGTRFLHHALDAANNSTVLHQPGPDLKETAVRQVVSTYYRDKQAFQALELSDFPALEEKMLRHMAVPSEVYGDSLNHMFPFGYLLYKHFGPERIRLIHLVRNPVDACRSVLKAERDDSGHGRFAELRPPEFLQGATAAEKAAGIWNGVNGLVRYQFQLIDDPRVCKTVRIEDVDVELVRELYDFLGLEGFNEANIDSLLGDKSRSVRHSHLGANPQRPDATDEELEVIERLCRPLAQQLGY